MTSDLLFEPLSFARGPAMKNRFALAPLTNQQSHADGRLSEEEFRWLTRRAQGGFGMVMTCAAHVRPEGQGFPGQLGIFSDDHLPGLTRLATAIRGEGALAIAQLHHAGMRAPAELIGRQPLCPSDNERTGARAMRGAEVEDLIEGFIAAAVRAQAAGFDGAELHGAHGYVLSEFLSPEINLRDDAYGGSVKNRARILFEIIDGVRDRCGPGFVLGLRLSPERFGLRLGDILEVGGRLLAEAKIDFLDMSLWDVRKLPEEEAFKDKSLLTWFAELPRGAVRLGVAGKVTDGDEARACLEGGADFAFIGRAAILHADLPQRVGADPGFRAIALPVTPEYLAQQGLSPPFVTYMRNWKGFVTEA